MRVRDYEVDGQLVSKREYGRRLQKIKQANARKKVLEKFGKAGLFVTARSSDPIPLITWSTPR